jgi:hypothetical protein
MECKSRGYHLRKSQKPYGFGNLDRFIRTAHYRALFGNRASDEMRAADQILVFVFVLTDYVKNNRYTARWTVKGGTGVKPRCGPRLRSLN